MPAPTKFKAREFRDMWSVQWLPAQAIADHLDINRNTVTEIARGLGEELRTDTRPSRWHIRPNQIPEFKEMWAAMVKAADMAKYFGCHARSVHNTAARLGLGLRGRRHHAQFITIADFRAMQLRNALAASAREEQAALRNAEMVDGDPRRWAA